MPLAARKVLTRAESQAQTRQSLLDSAEQMFYANGYHATSIAAIAAEAGRTIGAVYSNFDSKEALCLEVLRNRLLSEMTKLFEALVTAGESLDARFEALSSWWSLLSTETSLVLVTAEYLTSTLKDEGRVTNNREVVEGVKAVARAVFEDTLPDTISKTDPRVNDAVDAMVSTGAGLAVTQAMGVVDAERGARLMVATLRMWLKGISDPVEPAATG
jgi:AcrR family transcriptional regulator